MAEIDAGPRAGQFDPGIFGQRAGVAAVGIGQAEAVGKLRLLAARGSGDRNLHRRARPRIRQLAVEVVGDGSIACAQQHVGDALALAARQPRHHERIRCVDLAVHPQRPSGQEHRHHRHALRAQAAQQVEVVIVARPVRQVRQVTLEFRVRVLAEHHDGDVGFVLVAAIDRQLGAAAGRLHLRLDAGKDRGRAREIRIGQAGALPGQRPAAVLLGDVVGAVAGNQHVLARIDRQHAVVLQQHQRLAHRPARQRAMRGTADHLHRLGHQRIGRRQPRLEHAQAQLHAQDAAHCIVDAGHRDHAGLHLGQRVHVQALPRIGRFQHVQPGVVGHRAILVGAAGHLAVRVPVAQHDAAEVHAPLQHVGDQRLVAGHLHPVPAGERDHHHLHASPDRRRVAGRMHVAQHRFADLGVTLVLAIFRAAIADEMLGGGDDVVGIEVVRRAEPAFQALDHGAGVLRHQRRVLRITFVGATPAPVLRHREGGRESPVDAAGAQLPRGDLADRVDQLRIARGAQAHVLREQRAADQVVVAVHRVDAEQHRDRQAPARGIHRRAVERIGQLLPLRGRTVLLAVRPGVAAGQDRAEAVGAHVVRGHVLDVGLDHLPNLVLHRHFRQQPPDPGLERGVRRQRPVALRPRCGVDRGRGVRGQHEMNGHDQRASEGCGQENTTQQRGLVGRKSHGKAPGWRTGGARLNRILTRMTALSIRFAT